jgi:uncharacterized protein YdaU (DUF1376 family)
MIGKPPYFPFYVNDFAADGVVEAMTTEAVGAYILLLCKAWTQDPAGSIPADDTVLARWSRLSPERWSEVKSSVLAAFVTAKDNRLYQKRMRGEFAKLNDAYRRRSEGGAKGAASRWKKGHKGRHGKANGTPNGTPNGKSMASGSDSGSMPSGVQGGEMKDAFAAFWSAYPRKVGKSEARAAWAKLSPDESTRAAIMSSLSAQKPEWAKSEIKYTPHPTTWLNARRWEDEVPTPRRFEDANGEVECGPCPMDQVVSRIGYMP